MYATLRWYPGAGALGDAMADHAEDVEKIIKDVPGFVAYFAIRDGENVTSVTVCDDRAGTEESTRRAAEWVKENVKGTVGKPNISSGNVFISFSK
jgi:hypothetical protein